MRIVALLSWFDERPGWLAEATASIAAAGVDHLVAVDGAYASFPHARGGSPTVQADVVYHTARGTGMGATVHTPGAPWIGDEIAKRSFMFALGHLVAEPGEDWLWICDADEVIIGAPRVRDQLAETACDVAEVLLEPADGGVTPIRRLFRAHPRGIRAVGNHATYVDGAGRYLRGMSEQEPVDAEQATWDTRVLHRAHDARVQARDVARERYYAHRDAMGLEYGLRDVVAAA